MKCILCPLLMTSHLAFKLFQEDSEHGNLLMEFMFIHTPDFKEVASVEVQRDVREYLRSDQCSEVDSEGRVLMDAAEVVLVITK